MVGQYIKESNHVNQAFSCRYINLGTSRTVNEIGKNPLNKVGRYLSILLQVCTQLLRFKPHLCYLAITSKGIGFYKDSAVAFLVKLFRVKLVCHFHNKGVSTRQHKLFDNLLYKRVFKNTEVILLSKYLYYDIQQYVPENKVHYCANGIPKNHVNLTKNNQHESDFKTISHPVEILFLSNLIESKGISILLKACKILNEQQVPFHCTLVGGEGDISPSLLQQTVQKWGLDQYISYVGKKYGKEKDEVFVKADIFAFPTYYHNECFPLVLLEAMQYSLPIVSTFEGGIPDIVEEGKHGYLVPQKNAEALSRKLKVLIGDYELRKQMGKAGRKKFEKEYSLTAFENRLKEILDSL